MVNLSSQIAKTYQPIKLNKTHNVDEGGRACTKSSKNALLILFMMLKYNDCETMVIRQDDTHHRNTTLKELLTAAERLGLQENVHYKYTVSPKQITLFNGSSIYFGALNDHEKLKGFKPTNGKKFFGFLWFFECSEFKSDYDMEQAISTFSRGKKPFFYVMYETNPPADNFHWWYDWKKKVSTDESFKWDFRTYLDLTENERQEWLGKVMLEQIETLKRVDVEQYNHIYLGLPRVLTDAVYKNKPPIKARPDKFDFILCGLDYGEADATTTVFVGVKDNEYYIFDQYYHSGRSGKKKTIIDYKQEISEYVNRIYIREDVPMALFIETQPMTVYSMFTVDTLIDLNVDIKKVNKSKVNSRSKDAIQERIDITNILINNNQLFITSADLPIYKAFGQAVYRKGKRLDDGTTDIDSLDAFEYAIKEEFPHIIKTFGLGDEDGE